MGNVIENEISSIVSDILEDYKNGRAIDKIDLFHQPDKDVVVDIVHKLLKIVYPGYFWDKSYRIYTANNNLSLLIEDVMYNLNKQITVALRFRTEFEQAEETDVEAEAQTLSVAFFKKIPEIRAYLETDLEAAYDGDPAAYYRDEIILSYPGQLATTINRIAHELYLLEVPLIPRIMTEYAHSRTGIDIHPGATIGKYFFIDHGTGIVIGESTIIGEHVKIYQGVTLGALSTRGGQRLKSVKRHPTIEDNVTIYSGASILGGETVIGKNAVIGSNAFITKSIQEGTRVSIKNQELQFKYGRKEPVLKNDLEQDEAWYYTI
ncbi:MAG: serine acetyltransferase [Lachnospiraceae bacterium]|nr:serine acetyltransferase [Lachnospiraceae bacterium]